jgi:hypothetical protein
MTQEEQRLEISRLQGLIDDLVEELAEERSMLWCVLEFGALPDQLADGRHQEELAVADAMYRIIRAREQSKRDRPEFDRLTQAEKLAFVQGKLQEGAELADLTKTEKFALLREKARERAETTTHVPNL